jgi:hypothetical protein
MKHLLLAVAIALTACDDPIPGTCKTDSDCPLHVAAPVSEGGLALSLGSRAARGSLSWLGMRGMRGPTTTRTRRRISRR